MGGSDLEEHMADMAGAVGERWVVPAPTGRSAGDHVCWPFRDRGELAAVARAFVAEGLGRDERLAYVGQGRPRELRNDLAGLANLQDCLDRGQLQVTDIAAMPASDPAADPVDELHDLAAMTQDSLDAGYTGLRIGQRDLAGDQPAAAGPRIVRYEHLIDRFCLDHAFTGLCAFDATALGADVLAELGCVHTLTYGELSTAATWS
jgi:MEDS: MEthanogen/methylotroph, DcmR Sensory domain